MLTGAPNGEQQMSSDYKRMIWHIRCGSEMRRGQRTDVADLVGATEIQWWDVICRRGTCLL
jgi:hypothetical protein